MTGKRATWALHTNRGQEPDGRRQIIDPELQPAPTFTTKSGGQWHMKRQLRSNTSANASVRTEDEPAPTIVFGRRLNTVTWEASGVRMTPERGKGITERYGPRPGRAIREPSFAITAGITGPRYRWHYQASKLANATRRPGNEPAPTVLFGNGAANAGWAAGAPEQFDGEIVRISIDEAAVLQSFCRGYPWQGNKTQQFGQVGNCVPPLLAYAVLGAVI